MGQSMTIALNKKQANYMKEACGEKSLKKAFNMFIDAMTYEKIPLKKMPLLIDKLMAKEKKKRRGQHDHF